MRNHARELSIMSRGSHLVFSRDALKRASRSTNPPFRLPRLQGTAASVRIRGVTARICKGSSSPPPGHGPVPALLRLQASFVFVALQAGTHHFVLDGIIEDEPRFF